MKKIIISDMTLLKRSNALSFKDKIEITRHLDALKVDTVYLPSIVNKTTDSLLIRTVSSFVKNSTLAVCVGNTCKDVEDCFSAVKEAKNKRLSVLMPVSPIQMEYFAHKKPPIILELTKELISKSVSLCNDVEFIAQDATRADKKFLKEIISSAIELGVKTVTICDDEGVMLPDEFKDYVTEIYNDIPSLKGVKVGILCKDTNKMANASAVLSIKAGADEIKCAVGDCDVPSLDTFLGIINSTGVKLGVSSTINFNEFHRISKQIEWIIASTNSNGVKNASATTEHNVEFSANDDKDSIMNAVKKLGYDISAEDGVRVYEEFKRVALKKTITNKDLDAIVASVALQVPPIYKLDSYVINNGNIITSSAQIKVIKEDKTFFGISSGDGPIDASFRAIEQILGHKYELDDFQIQSVTEGKEAVGSAIVKLRNNGKLYSGNGISTDIIGASIRAYINAVNKIVYEEEN